MPEDERQKLTLEQAFQTVDKACAVFQGTRADHVILQQSMQLLGKLVAEESARQKAEEASMEHEDNDE
jgi:hypothetical protein